MQPASRRQAKAGDISGIRWNFWFNEHDVQNIPQKNKKSASTSEALFPSGGNI
jgi:hypothetical protein